MNLKFIKALHLLDKGDYVRGEKYIVKAIKECDNEYEMLIMKACYADLLCELGRFDEAKIAINYILENTDEEFESPEREKALYFKNHIEVIEKIRADNSRFGGAMVSKNVLDGVPIKYTYREESSINEFSGWSVLSEKDDDEYVRNDENFVLVTAEKLFGISPIMEQLYEAPCGTNLCWEYDKNSNIDFFDLTQQKYVTPEQILGTN